MERKKKQKHFLPVLLGIGIGVVLGIVMGNAGGLAGQGSSLSLGRFLLTYLGMVLALVLAIYLQLILHELGHLIAGSICGYRFSSFRIGSLMLLRTKEGYQWKRFSLAGTGGQCLLIPPERQGDSFPFRFYLLGGVLMNLVTAALSLLAYLFLGRITFLLCLVLAGAALALMNGLPLNMGAIVNDGYNVLALGRDGNAREALWKQLTINALQTEGIRLRDMPEDLFSLPEDADRHNVLVSTIAVFRENRLMDQQRLDEARQLIDALLSDRYTVIGLYRIMLMLDQVFIDLLTRGKEADTSPLTAQENQAVLRQMKSFPSILRTQYAAAVLKEQDPAKADGLRAQFEKAALRYPSPADIDTERGLMMLVR